MQMSNVLDINLIKTNKIHRNDFIQKYMPFIASETSKVTKKVVNYGEDDELSVALIAFDEAIEKYNGSKNFFDFSKLVIRSRLKDYYKSQKKFKGDEAIYTEDDKDTAGIIEFAKAEEFVRSQDEDRKSEIVSLCSELDTYSIDLFTLPKVSPKHKEKKKFVDNLIQNILKDEEMVFYLKNEKTLPLKIIEEKLKVPRKKIEVYRKYIIVMIIIASSDEYNYLKSYLSLK